MFRQRGAGVRGTAVERRGLASGERARGEAGGCAGLRTGVRFPGPDAGLRRNGEAVAMKCQQTQSSSGYEGGSGGRGHRGGGRQQVGDGRAVVIRRRLLCGGLNGWRLAIDDWRLKVDG